ncbi:MAG TPA: DUF4446 family protein [Patescibacteria group bacterium]|nr:DUF4446 family protein [Patescibacteria group bacterium]
MLIGLFVGVGVFVCIWLALVTVYVVRLSSHYNTLVKATNKRSLQAILEGLLEEMSNTKKAIEILKKRCDTIEQESKLHIQRIGLLRFNPFKDTGGDQSFILTLVDGNNTGVVISGLYSRAGTRWYAKQIQNGKGKEHELSDEEKQALQILDKK